VSSSFLDLKQIFENKQQLQQQHLQQQQQQQQNNAGGTMPSET
jgi:hypothetical protein